MITYRRTRTRAFTLVELMLTVLIATIVILGAGVMLVDSLRGYNKLYARVNEGIVRDAYVSRITFDKTVRKASRSLAHYQESGPGAYVRVYYFASPSVPVLDRYSQFYESAGELFVTHGTRDDSGNLSPVTDILLAENVESVVFDVVGGGRVSMVLTLNDQTRRMTVMTSAVRHNE